MSKETEGIRPNPEVTFSRRDISEIEKTFVKHSEWRLKSGRQSENFIDLDELFAPQASWRASERLIKKAIEQIGRLRKQYGYEVLGFIESPSGPAGALAARTELSRKCGIPSLVIRPGKRVLSQALKPHDVPLDAKVLIVTDVTTTGRTLGDAASILWRRGLHGCGVLTFFDREEGASDYFDALGVNFHVLLSAPGEGK